RRDNNFSLLELRKIACAYVAHAGGDCTDEILAAVVHFGRAEENLLQRTSRTHLDARATRKIGMRSSHAPMVAASWRFVRLGKRAAHHDRVCAASQRLTNV